jgi:protein-tyrosine phosphatase
MNGPGRHLDWDGCANVRDLGGLPTVDGRRTRTGAVVRADALDRLTAKGWAALEDHGVRTVVDLRNDDEREPDAAPRPAGLVTHHLPLDGIEDREFWDVWATGPQFGTPLYYRPFLERFPARTAGVVRAIARARPGGVVFHCSRGRDRTGLVSIVLLLLAGVDPEEIAADYGLSAERVRIAAARFGREDEGPVLEAFLRDRGTTAREIILSELATLDVAAHLRDAGLAADDVDALRERMLELA